jgi:Spy/CpxP family protein refolding chaperone
MHRWTSLLLLSLVSFAPLSAQAGGPPEIRAVEAMHGRKFDAVADRLKLSPELRTKVQDSVYKSSSAALEIKARIDRAELDLKHLMAQKSFDEKAVMKAVDALNAAEADLRKNRMQLMLDVRKLLTPEQWAELVRARAEQRERRHDRNGGPRGGKGGPGMGGMHGGPDDDDDDAGGDDDGR